MNANDVRKAGLLGGTMVGSLAVGVSAQDVPTVDDITGGSSGGGTISTGDITGGGDSQIGSDEGLAVADASGGNRNVSFVS